MELTEQDVSCVSEQEREQILCRRIGDSLLYDTYDNAVAALKEHEIRLEAIRAEIGSLQDQYKHTEDRPIHDEGIELEEDLNESRDSDGRSESAGPASNTVTGGWHREDHLLFVKAWRECVDRGKGHKIFRKRLGLLLPHMNRDDITAHGHWFERQRFLQRKVKEEHERWGRSCVDILRRSGEEFREAVRRSVDQERSQAEWLKTREAQSSLHKKLSKMRIVFEKQRREKRLE